MKFHLAVEKHVLKSGLKVLLHSRPKAALCAYYWGIPTGSRHESAGESGLSHMFEHLMFRGTKKYPHFDSLYDRNGVAAVNAHTSYDYTGYLGQFPMDKLDLIMDVESDRIAHLILNQDVLDRERKAVLEERRLSLEDSPQGALHQALFESVFKSHPYRRPILGLKRDILAYQPQQLKKWMREHYRPSHITLALSGPFGGAAPLSCQEVLKKAQRAFGGLRPAGGASPPAPALRRFVEPPQKRPRRRVLQKNVQSLEICLAYRGPKEDSQDALALQLLALILGGGEGSRLFAKLVRRERLLSDISAYFAEFVDYGVFVISCSLPDPSKEGRVKALILDEAAGFSPITERERAAALNSCLKDQVDLLKSSSHVAAQLAYYEMQYQDFRKMERRLSRMAELSARAIEEAGRRCLKRRNLSYIKMEPKPLDRSS